MHRFRVGLPRWLSTLVPHSFLRLFTDHPDHKANTDKTISLIIVCLLLFACLWGFQQASAFGVCLLLLGEFHCGEYLYSFIFFKTQVNNDHFFFNPSPVRVFGLVFLILEFFIENVLSMPWTNASTYAWALPIGSAVAVLGFLCRQLSFFHAGNDVNLKELSDPSTNPKAKLMTGGIYRYCAHPGYAGLYWHTVGVCVVLATPLSLALSVLKSKAYAVRLDCSIARTEPRWSVGYPS